MRRKNNTAGGLVQGYFAGKTVFQEFGVKDKFIFKTLINTTVTYRFRTYLVNLDPLKRETKLANEV